MAVYVWVSSWQVKSTGNVFAVDDTVTWPISGQLNRAALTETVGAAVAAEITLGVDWHALRPSDTVDRTGVVTRIVGYRSRLSRGHVVPGTVEVRDIVEADGWESEEDGLISAGYLVSFDELA